MASYQVSKRPEHIHRLSLCQTLLVQVSVLLKFLLKNLVQLKLILFLMNTSMSFVRTIIEPSDIGAIQFHLCLFCYL